MIMREEQRDIVFRYKARDHSCWMVRAAMRTDLDDLVALDDITKPVPWGRDAIGGFIGCVPGVFVLCPSNHLGWSLGAPVGFVIARWLGDECEIMSIGVHPQFRRRGLGGMLMDAVKKTALAYGRTSLILEVREHNKAAHSLYVRSGLLEVGRRPRYYLDTGEAAILMRGNLLLGGGE
ncbi:MAG TPA: GNAT family N-acetyltransferase [Clostridiaceae bacterium]|nr:GNAT family N-acetyltransferase [Clostridiaceae bacterium]